MQTLVINKQNDTLTLGELRQKIESRSDGEECCYVVLNTHGSECHLLVRSSEHNWQFSSISTYYYCGGPQSLSELMKSLEYYVTQNGWKVFVFDTLKEFVQEAEKKGWKL